MNHPLCLFGLLLIVWPAAITCAAERVFEVEGVVRAPYAEGSITIAHEEIPGFMPAMTMPFHVEAAEVHELAAGDRVAFRFVVGEERSWATGFRRLGRADATSATPETRAGSATRRLREGDAVPPFELIDQDGRAFTQRNLSGRRTLLTFIFTRCPVPDFCPLLMERFRTLQRKFAAEPRDPPVQLVSLTIDPEHDQPSVLREYGTSLEADFAQWHFLTGSTAQVAEFTRWFAVRVEPGEGTLNHTLATALITPDGRIERIWRGNFWKPEEVLAALNGE